MKLYPYPDEWYPVIVPQKEGTDEPADFTPEEVMEIKRVFREFDMMQNFLFEKFGKEKYRVASEDLEDL